jgi:hypothetical protein
MDRRQETGFRIQKSGAGDQGLQEVAQDKLVGEFVCGSQPETKDKSDQKGSTRRGQSGKATGKARGESGLVESDLEPRESYCHPFLPRAITGKQEESAEMDKILRRYGGVLATRE